MSRYVHPTEQLVIEIVVRDIRRSFEFYQRLGFKLLRDGGDFVELTWKTIAFFLPSGRRFTMPRICRWTDLHGSLLPTCA